jgi:diketogulonate reductase-like aldo/keto reductase
MMIATVKIRRGDEDPRGAASDVLLTITWMISLLLLALSSSFSLTHCIASHNRPTVVQLADCPSHLTTLTTTTAIIMPKRKRRTAAAAAVNDDDKDCKTNCFRETSAAAASCLTDGVVLATPAAAAGTNTNKNDAVVIMPWMGFGTYKLGKAAVVPAVLQALQTGYRAIDTAFIYGGETTEKLVQQALEQHTLQRAELFVTTKHWRKYHGYEPTLQCLRLSLLRLQLDHVDLYLMHWPGPAWTTMHRLKQTVQKDPWHYAATDAPHMAAQRAETWRGMEEAVRRKWCRAIGVSNFSVQHLQTLKTTAVLWPPAVNQVEFQYVLCDFQ